MKQLQTVRRHQRAHSLAPDSDLIYSHTCGSLKLQEQEAGKVTSGVTTEDMCVHTYS